MDSKESKPVNLKGNQPEYSLEGLMLKLQYSGHLMWRTNSLEKTLMLGKTEVQKRRQRQRMRCLGGITDSKDISFCKLWEIVKDREAWRAAVHRAAKSRTRLSDWTRTTMRRRRWLVPRPFLVESFSKFSRSAREEKAYHSFSGNPAAEV